MLRCCFEWKHNFWSFNCCLWNKFRIHFEEKLNWDYLHLMKVYSNIMNEYCSVSHNFSMIFEKHSFPPHILRCQSCSLEFALSFLLEIHISAFCEDNFFLWKKNETIITRIYLSNSTIMKSIAIPPKSQEFQFYFGSIVFGNGWTELRQKFLSCV